MAQPWFPLRLARPDRLTAVWGLLLALSGLGVVAGGHLSGRDGGIAVLALALFKAQLLVDHFMGLRRVGRFWRGLMALYLLGLGGVMAAAYLIH